MTKQITFKNKYAGDNNFFLFLMILIWIVIISGFGYDLLTVQKARGFKFPLIIHFHAAAFVGWLVLLTVQLALIRKANYKLHKKLGIAGAYLAGIMVVLGLAAALISESVKFGTPAADTAFIAIMFCDILYFGIVAGAGLYLRKSPAAHKRLLLIATIAITDAGFGRSFSLIYSRMFGPYYWTLKSFAEGFWPYVSFQMFGTLFLMLLLGAYDLYTRKRLHPVYIYSVALYLVLYITAGWLYFSPTWMHIARGLIGH